LERTLNGHENAINVLAMSADDSILVSGGEDGQVLAWDVGGEGEHSGEEGHDDNEPLCRFMCVVFIFPQGIMYLPS